MKISAWKQAAVALALCLLAGLTCLVLLTVTRLREVEQLRGLAHEEQEIGLRFHRDGAALILDLHSAALRLGDGEVNVGKQDQYTVLFARNEAFFRQPPVSLTGKAATSLEEVQKDLRIYGEQVQSWLALPDKERLAGVMHADEPFRELLRDLQALRDACGFHLLDRVSEMRDSMRELQWLVVTAAVVMAPLFGVLLWMIYRGWFRPLQEQAALVEHAKTARDEMASLSSLAAGLAHEIRNPVGALKNRAYALGLLVDAELQPKVAAQVASMNRELDRVEHIVGDFLIYARPSEPRIIPCALAELVDMFHHDHQAEMQQRGVRFELGVVEDASFHADPELLRQALLNLVRNAAEACSGRTDGCVQIEALALERRIVLAVTDNGPGVPEDLQERLFKPFATLKRGGTGLGLTISRSIARRHGGDLLLASTSAEGTRFELRLPRL
ncbi:sensor histidine kinase [Prosthecobacter fluviatilis]|uniref:histidine kinase n=1 Tax=Prosthecobacter fluviatilis TaxID=445931 RepID=A0ABW0KS99_9BACT